jgi:hypothetical protein
MKCELFGLTEINPKEAFLLIQVCKKNGLDNDKILNHLHCIDELLVHERSKMLMIQRRCDRKRSKEMINAIIDKFL